MSSQAPAGRASRGWPDVLVRAVSWTVCLVLAWFVLSMLVAPVRTWPYFSRFSAWGVALLWVGACVALRRWGARPVAWLEEHTVVRRTGGALLLAVGMVVMVRLAMAVRFYPGWDAGMVEAWAHGLADGSMDRDTENYRSMANIYPNNVALVGVLTRWFQLCTMVGIESAAAGVVVLNVLALGAALALTWTLARLLAGPLAGYVAMLLAVPLVVVSPWLGVAYSDTLGAVFPVAILTLFVLARRAPSRWLPIACWVGIGVLALVGYRLKPTVVFALGAVLTVTVLLWRRVPGTVPGAHLGAKEAGRRLVALLAALVVGGVLAGTALSVVVDRLDVAPRGAEKQFATPMTHFLMMGAKERPGAYGSWNAEDIAFTTALPAQDRTSETLQEYLRRVEEWGPVGYPVFLHEKAVWILDDGNFNAFGHGMASRDEPWDFTDPVSTALRPWVAIQFDEYRWIALARHSAWLAVLLLVVAPVLAPRSALHGVEAAALRLSVAGLITFLLFFEGGSRYLYLYLPVLLVLASVSVVGLRGRGDAATPGPQTVSGDAAAGSDLREEYVR